jgi:uncharacterized protein (UPF0262 family)
MSDAALVLSPADPAATPRDIVRIELPEHAPLPSPFAEADRQQAVADLLSANSFSPAGLPPGPYALHLALRDGRLLLDVRDAADSPLHAYLLALGPFRRLIKDYHMVISGHEEAVTAGAADSRIQAIDMGRRGLHNEAAELLQERLEGRVVLDFETARRLFTLVCAMHQRI